MNKRDILDEILAKKERIGHRELRAATGLLKIKQSLERSDADQVSRSLSVVAIVSCVEVAARDAIALLIDGGTPYADRVADLLKGESRFSLDVVRAFQDRRVSLGEFVAHLLPISSLARTSPGTSMCCLVNHLSMCLRRSASNRTITLMTPQAITRGHLWCPTWKRC